MTVDVVDVAVVGAGVVGAAVARRLGRARLRVALVEAGPDVGAGTSKANTAILHTGFDAKPGTAESRLVARGHALLCRRTRRRPGSRSSGPAHCSWPGPRNSATCSPGWPSRRPPTATTAATSSAPPSCTGGSRTWPRRARRRHRSRRVPGLPVDHAVGLRHRGGRQRCRPPPIVPSLRCGARRRPLAARHAHWTAALRLGRQRRGPARRRVRAMLRARRLHRDSTAGPADRLRQARPTTRAPHPAAGADGALEGRAREPHRLRQRAARARRPRTSRTRPRPRRPRTGSPAFSSTGAGSCRRCSTRR